MQHKCIHLNISISQPSNRIERPSRIRTDESVFEGAQWPDSPRKTPWNGLENSIGDYVNAKNDWKRIVSNSGVLCEPVTAGLARGPLRKLGMSTKLTTQKSG